MRHNSFFCKLLTVAVALVMLTATIAGGYFAAITDDVVHIHVDESTQYQTFRYFGASSAWNYRILGAEADESIKTEIIDALYGDNGLQLSIFRYNLGAGSAEQSDCPYGEERRTESPFLAENYTDQTSFDDPTNYDITKDAAYIDMMKRAFATGNVQKLVIFCNSPHYLLTANGKTHGDGGNADNLPVQNFAAFSRYVLICADLIASMLQDSGYEFEVALSPVNEPQWEWGGEFASQEGCHYEPQHMAEFYSVFYRTMLAYNAAHGTAFVMDVCELGNYDEGNETSRVLEYLNAMSGYDYYEAMDSISVHSYWSDFSRSARHDFSQYMLSEQKDIAMSEYCVMQGGLDHSVDMGIYSTTILMQDLNLLNAREWSWWLSLAFGGYEDGLVYLDRTTNAVYLPYRYYMYGQFMRYIRYGDVRIKAYTYDLMNIDDVDCVAFSRDDGTIVVIVLNSGKEPKQIRIDGVGYEKADVISTSAQGCWLHTPNVAKKELQVAAQSVTTFVIRRNITN